MFPDKFVPCPIAAPHVVGTGSLLVPELGQGSNPSRRVSLGLIVVECLGCLLGCLLGCCWYLMQRYRCWDL